MRNLPTVQFQVASRILICALTDIDNVAYIVIFILLTQWRISSGKMELAAILQYVLIQVVSE